MQNENYNKDNKIVNMEVTKVGNKITEPEPEQKMTFDQLCTCMTTFFDSRDYESKQGFKKGYSCTVGEDYTNIDLLCNMNDLIYTYCSNNDKISKADKVNLKNICKGIQSVTKGIEQFNITTQMDRILIATLMGYILKITRNYFHDKR